jgi:exopolysaccharide production protein ExoZ
MLFNVQVLRGVAAAIVIWVHAQTLVSPDAVPPVLRQFGYGGVDLFFVISGFIMVHTTRRGTTGPLAFWRKRLVRIVPLYYFFTIMTVLVAVLLPRLLQSTEAHPDQVVRSLLFLPFEKTPGRIYPIYYLGWTLNFEMFFYAIFGALLLFAYRARTLALLVVLAALALGGRWIDNATSQGVALFFYTRPIVLDFALGVIIAHALSPGERNVRPAISWCLLGLGAVWMIFGGFVFRFGESGVAPPMDTLLRFGVPASLIVAGAVCLEQAGVRIGTRFARMTGDASYSIYLSHYFFVGLVVAIAARLSLSAGPQYVLAALTCVAAVLLGIAVYRLIERPLGGDLSTYRNAAGWLKGWTGRLAFVRVRTSEREIPKPGGPALG